jgi:cell pole-organizing protein PopZ
MSDAAAAPEPTMEEILASIRRIISEDDAPAADGEAEAAPEPVVALAPEPEPEPEPEAKVEPEPVEDVLELTQRVEPTPPPAAETVGDLDVYTKAEPEPEPKPVPPAKPELVAVAAGDDDEELVGESTAFAAASHFGNLTASIPLPAQGRTLEDLTRELLRPLLKAWLDENLPRIVESKVAEEVERISRTRVR